MCLCTGVHSSEDTLKESVSSFQCLGSEDQTQVVKTRHAYLLSHLGSSTARILEHLNKPIHLQGRRDGSVVESTYCSSSKPRLGH